MPSRFAYFLYDVAMQASSDVGGFNPTHVLDQLRVAFQASQVGKKKTRHEDVDAPRAKRRKTKKHVVFTSSSDEPQPDDDKDDEQLRDESDFHHTLVHYETASDAGSNDEAAAQ